ncbi:MAG: hypothetical protein EZS28_027014 [Streblomastix strix]|uniref:Uncharacterized protein n=1 Tax=Streblomastix strix TaxID=222440 RepID=A0A5J4V590_9EUKA|nr:MAG: hypothetical protein EZS28_027014 [Streblomastix strix]
MSKFGPKLPIFGRILKGIYIRQQYDTKEENCPCPDKTNKIKWDADPRTVAKGICAFESVRVVMGVVAAAVVLPVLALFC